MIRRILDFVEGALLLLLILLTWPVWAIALAGERREERYWGSGD